VFAAADAVRVQDVQEHLLICKYVETGAEVPVKGHYRLCVTCHGSEDVPVCLVCCQICHQGARLVRSTYLQANYRLLCPHDACHYT